MKNKIASCPAVSGPLKKNSVVLGKYEGEFYRCKVLKQAGKGFYSVYFLDYGNTSKLAEGDLRVCPSEISGFPNFLYKCRLAHVKYPRPELEFGEDSIDGFEDLVIDKEVTVKFLRREGGVHVVEVYLNKKLELKDQVNYLLVKTGYVVLDERDRVAQLEEWRSANEAGYQINPELIAVISNMDDVY